jgi:ribosomal protein S18 acetylase RimI-like enzyme
LILHPEILHPVITVAAITKTIAPSVTDNQLRPFDMRRDLGAVADLVELCFADTLDSDGRDYVARMRSAARNSPFLSWASATSEWTNVPMGGFVYLQDGRLVGNASLIPYYVKGRRFFLIANVAVHPDYRRQGIARRLTERAIEFARQKGTPSTWLHVREENFGAVRLYQSLGFQERAVRTTWISQPDYTSGEPPPGMHFINPDSRRWPVYQPWLQHSYPQELAWHIPFHAGALNPGWQGTFSRFIYNTYVQQWGLLHGERLLGVAIWQSTTARANWLWLAAPQTADEAAMLALLVYVRRHAPTQRPLVLDYPAHRFDPAIEAAGFAAQQTLIWMELPFSK